MLDYRGLEALFTVIQLQSFELAAKKLHITQSAISQRIKVIENFYGTPLLIRTHPYKSTQLGESLLGHFKQLMLLEDNLNAQINDWQTLPRITIAINRDSLETWFIKVIAQSPIFSKIMLEIIADDQEITQEYLKKGLAAACLSTSSQAISGCHVTPLGNMDYVMVASPEFKQQYFKKKNNRQNLLSAPAVIFDNNDKLHDRYMKKFFDIDEAHPQCHVVPSVAGFREFAIRGYGYALIPRIDIEHELKTGKLQQLFPTKIWKMPLYWHHWAIQPALYKQFNAYIIKIAKDRLLDTKKAEP